MYNFDPKSLDRLGYLVFGGIFTTGLLVGLGCYKAFDSKPSTSIPGYSNGNVFLMRSVGTISGCLLGLYISKKILRTW